jgi:hypothetical protein
MTWQPDLWSFDARATAVAEADESEETHRKPTQAGKILAHLRAGNRLTALDALERFQCFRLAARVHELRREGWAIEERMVETGSGKRVAEYSLEGE